MSLPKGLSMEYYSFSVAISKLECTPTGIAVRIWILAACMDESLQISHSWSWSTRHHQPIYHYCNKRSWSTPSKMIPPLLDGLDFHTMLISQHWRVIKTHQVPDLTDLLPNATTCCISGGQVSLIRQWLSLERTMTSGLGSRPSHVMAQLGQLLPSLKHMWLVMSSTLIWKFSQWFLLWPIPFWSVFLQTHWNWGCLLESSWSWFGYFGHEWH